MGLSVGSSIKSVVQVAHGVIKFFLPTNLAYDRQRWGSRGYLLSLVRLVDTRAVRQLHWNINTWTDEEVMSWKQSYMSACSSIAVAVSKIQYDGRGPLFDHGPTTDMMTCHEGSYFCQRRAYCAPAAGVAAGIPKYAKHLGWGGVWRILQAGACSPRPADLLVPKDVSPG